MDKDEIKFLMSQCYLSTKATAKILFPERFFRPFSGLTDDIFKALDDDSIQKVVIKAPRGWGKTSITNLAYPAKKILFQDKKFIVPVSNTATQAVMQSENLKRELVSNVAINRIFGSVKSDSFSKEMWVTSGGTAILPRGAGQQVRGILFGDSRPDLIIFDDVEDSESVKNEEQRKKLKEWMFSDVLNSVDRGRHNWKIVFIGTLLHEDSLLAALLEDDTWYKIEIDLCDDNLNSNWEDFMSTEEVRKLYNGYSKQGLLDVFYREYRGVPIATETASFKQTYFKYYSEVDDTFVAQKKKLENIVIIDPAKTTNFMSAESAIVGVGVNVEIPRIFVRDVVADKLHPDQIYDRAFNMAALLNAKVIGYEVTSLNEFITYPITTEMIRRGKMFNLVELKARGEKAERIASLIPFYRMGYIFHNDSGICAGLESQLLSYPRSKRWDIMDALAYVVEMLELGERYFVPDETLFEDPIEQVEREFDELLQDTDPYIRNWRHA